MIFNSYIFLFGFFPITFIVFWLLKNRQHRYIWLTLTGYIFYGYWNWKFVLLMLVTTSVDFFAAQYIERHTDNKRKMKYGLLVSIIVGIGMLVYFKYANFFAGSFVGVINLFGLTLPKPNFNIILPISISFYIFETISYTVDVYRRKIHATKNFFEYSTFIAFFPHLVAGPILRYADLAHDLDNIDKQPKTDFFFRGINLFVIGLIKKVIIADSIAAVIDPMLANYAGLSSVGAWLAILGYTYQLYFDFSGYSDMAIGLGSLFGFKFLQNFNSPYKATSITDFWRRWHISLSGWLRDYLYIPLGGSRLTPSRTYINLMLTMFLGGLWHGANWTFAIWGIYHGALLSIHKMFTNTYEKIPVFIQRALTFLLVMIGWVFFRSSDFTMAAVWLKKMFNLPLANLNWAGISAYGSQLVILLFAATIITQFFKNTFEINYSPKLKYAIGLAVAFVICLVLLNYKQSVFIYYQF